MHQKVYLCRHGETEWSKSGKHTSFTDLDLTENGMCQASTLHPKVKHLKPSAVYISPLKRARETAKLAKMEGEIHDDLFEWRYGDYEGLTTPQIQEQEADWNIFTHGAKGGESVEEIQLRADRLIDFVRQIEGDVVLFSSGHITRVIGARWIGAPVEFGRHLALSTASYCVLGYEHKLPAILCWNDTSHYKIAGADHGKCAA